MVYSYNVHVLVIVILSLTHLCTCSTLAPPLEEEPECDSGDSSSDDEKGGTISKSL